MDFEILNEAGKVIGHADAGETSHEEALRNMKRCPFFQGVCGIDERILCYDTSQSCDIYKKNKPIEIANISEAAPYEGKYVIYPGCKFPVYVPKRSKDGTPILPESWYDEYDE